MFRRLIAAAGIALGCAVSTTAAASGPPRLPTSAPSAEVVPSAEAVPSSEVVPSAEAAPSAETVPSGQPSSHTKDGYFFRDDHVPVILATEELVLTIPGPDRVQLEMKRIPEGTFQRGSPGWEKDRYDDEGPTHQVTISKPFYMGTFEVTQAQWEAVMGENPSRFSGRPDNPVEQVSWEDCQRFIETINEMGIGTFRLPTEAEWEYACRAGTSTRFYWGEDPEYRQIDDHAWYKGNSDVKPHRVGEKMPNAWGLYDMSGNVWEWCSDWYGSYGAGPQTDPVGVAEEPPLRVARGGGWGHPPVLCRSANRYRHAPSNRHLNQGLRLVRLVE